MPNSSVHSAVILARGLGTRMRKEDPRARLTEEQEAVAQVGLKAMISVGRPFLDYVLSALADAGFERVCLVIGPEHQSVADYYRKQSLTRITLEFAVQEKPLGTADALLAAEAFCGRDPFILLNSDNYYPVEALRLLRETTPPAIVGFVRSALIEKGNVPPDRVARFGALVVDHQGYLVRIIPREDDVVSPNHSEVLSSMNCWLFDSSIFEACRKVTMSPRNELELPRAVQLGIDTMGMRFRVIRVELPVLDMSTRSDIAAVQERLSGLNVLL
ncbi:MAG TPA: nucleotidyltransferase family protein [Gemmatimonadaceae bacterium]|nr:nucleotidyltransferase family protein [Gemmatimonadaceae bacterium]